MKKAFIILCFFSFIGVQAKNIIPSTNSVKDSSFKDLGEVQFKNPPRQARPATYWMWMNGNITKEGLTADLEYMKRTGYGGALMFNVSVGIPQGTVYYNSPAWIDATLHAVKEAERLDMELFLQNSPGYSGTGGPWITPELSMQQLEWTETMVSSDGRGTLQIKLPQPVTKHEYYRDAFVLAYPSLKGESKLFSESIARVLLGDKELDRSILTDYNLDTQVHLENSSSFITFELDTPSEARSITIRRGHRELPLDPHDGPRDYAPTLILEASEDGIHYTKVTAIQSVALREYDTPSIATFPAVIAQYYRIRTNRSTNLSEIMIHGSSRLNNWIEKTNYASIPVRFEENSQMVEPDQSIPSSAVVNVTSYMDKNGNLKWKAPKGRWTIVRIGSTTTGEVQAAAPSSCVGLECDKFSAEAVDLHFDQFLDPVLNKLKPWCGTTLTALMMDSWEAGKQNWTPALPTSFKEYRGYDLMPYLLAMTGLIVDNVSTTEAFLWDMRRTHTDLFNKNFLGRFKERAARYGLKFAAEPYGDGNFESLEYAEHLDYPMSEFWIHYIYGGVTTSKLAASTAHLWNRPIVGAECFTGTPFNSKFTEHPYAMKAVGDYMMTVGVNRLVYHVYAHQPYMGSSLGTMMTMGPFGTHLNRNSTWAEQAVGFNIYNGRCAYMLQQGRFVADILYIKDEEISANIPDYDITEPATPYGYRWDIGSRNILEKLKVEDGQIVLPYGMKYRILVLTPMAKATPELLRSVKSLIEAGATVVLSGDMPYGYPGLSKSKNKELLVLAKELWSNKSLGEGNIHQTKHLKQVLQQLKIKPDFSFIACNRDAQIHFIHRKVGQEEIYFVTNHRRRPEKITASFRVSGLVPEIWNAETGETGMPIPFIEEDGRTKVTLSLTESGSSFIVFRNKQTDKKCPAFETVKPTGKISYNPQKFTLSLWAKPETFAHSGRGYLLYPMSGEADFGKGHAYVGVAMGQNGVRIHERSGSNKVVLFSEKPIEGWTHVALVYNEGTPTLYLNGEQIATGKQSPYICHPAIDLPMAEEQYIGSFEGDQTATGYLSHALSADEVKQLYAQGLPAPVVPEDCSLLKLVTGEWNVQFPAWSKTPASIVLNELQSLHKHEDFNIKHFSGTAIYTKTIRLTKKELKNRRILLDLGRVENLAEVSINGQASVLLWKAPYRVDITDRVTAGNNELVVKVTNLYPNRMIGDEHLEERYAYDTYGRLKLLPGWYIHSEKDDSRERVLFSPWKHYTKNDPLLESGLLGPVRIIVERASDSLR